MAPTTYTGVIDRFEDELAVILLEADGEVVDEVVLDRAELPPDADQTDAILQVTVSEDGEVIGVEYEPDETAERKEQAQSRFDRLAERPPESDDEESS